MPDQPLIYLDNAATSFPKPESVYAAMDRYNRELGVPIGRAAYGAALEAEQVVSQARRLAAQLLNAEGPERIVLTFNCTDSLNSAIHGIVRPGDHVVTSSMEHNSVMRPLRALEDSRGIRVTVVPARESGLVEPEAIRAAIRPETRLIALIHASNVTGTIQPVQEVGTIARAAGIPFLVDAAQTAGHVPIDLGCMPVDLLACAGHKGLAGPLGTGLLYLRPGIEQRVRSLRQGGTGTRSEDDHQPDAVPEKYESGNHNAPGLFGLHAALTWLSTETMSTVAARERELTCRLVAKLRALAGVTVYSHSDGLPHVGVVSVSIADMDARIAASLLDESFGIRTRAGLHCAPLAHRTIGTLERGGTLRFSVGPFSTNDDVDQAVNAVRVICAEV